MAEGGSTANVDLKLNIETIAQNTGQMEQHLQSLSQNVGAIAQRVTSAQASVAGLISSFEAVGKKGIQGMDSLKGAIDTATVAINDNVQVSRVAAQNYDRLNRTLQGLPSTIQGAFRNMQQGAVQGSNALGQQTASVRNLQTAMGQMGHTGRDAFSGLSQQIFGSLYGLQFLINQIRNVTNAIENMDLLRASYARIMGANLGSGVDNATKDMMQDSMRIAYQYGASMKDVAGVMVEFARQGRSVDEVKHLTESIGELRLTLATSTGRFLSMSEAMRSATTLMTQLDISVYQAVDALKLMAEYDIRAATSFDQISEAMNRFAAAGKLAGMSTPEIIKAATAFTEIGVGASRAGTALNTTISRLTGTQKAIDALNEVGYSLTVIEGGATRATSSFEQLVEAYRKVVASGSNTKLNQFLTDIAGARQRSVVAAGLNRYIKQTSSAVSDTQFQELTKTLQAAFTQALTLPAIQVKTSTFAFSNMFDPTQIKQTLSTQLNQLIQDLQTEFQQTGRVTRPNLESLVSRWFGGLSTDETKQFVEANVELFGQLQRAIDDFMRYTESPFDKYQRYVGGMTAEVKRIQQEALTAMQDTIAVQRNRLSTLFESTFLQQGFTDPMRAGFNQLISSVERLARTITTVLGGALSIIGGGDASKGVERLIVLLETWLTVKLPSMVVGAFQGVAGAVGGAFKPLMDVFKIFQQSQSVGSGLSSLLVGLGSGQGLAGALSRLSSGTSSATGLTVAINTLTRAFGGNQHSVIAWLNTIQAGKGTVEDFGKAINICGRHFGLTQNEIVATVRTVPSAVAGFQALAGGAAGAGAAVKGLSVGMALLNGALGVISVVLGLITLGTAAWSIWKSWTKEQTELNNGLSIMREQMQANRRTVEDFSRALDKMKESSESLGTSLGRAGDYISKFVMNHDVRDALAESLANTTNRPDLKAMPMSKRKEEISRELLFKFPEEYINYTNQYAQRSREAAVNGQQFTEKMLNPVEYLGQMFSVAGEYINNQFTDQLAQVGNIWLTMSVAVAQGMTSALKEITEGTQILTANVKTYKERLAQRQKDILGESVNGKPITAEIWDANSSLQQDYLTDQLTRAWNGKINPNLVTTPHFDQMAHHSAMHFQSLGARLEAEGNERLEGGGERYIQGYIKALLKLMGVSDERWNDIEKKTAQYGKALGIAMDRTKIKTADHFAKYMLVISQFLGLNYSTFTELAESWNQGRAALAKQKAQISLPGLADFIPKDVTADKLTDKQLRQLEEYVPKQIRSRKGMLEYYRKNVAPVEVPVPELTAGNGETPLDSSLVDNQNKEMKELGEAMQTVNSITKSTTMVLNQETDAQTRLKAMVEQASDRVKSLNEAYEDLIAKRGTWQEARAEGDPNWKKYAEEELALKQEQLKALEEEKRLLNENAKLRIDTAVAEKILDPKHVEDWKKIYGEAFSPQPLLDAQQAGLDQLTKFQNLLANKSLALNLSPEDLQKMKETQQNLDRYDEAVKEAFADHARAYLKARENLNKVKNNSKSTKAQIKAAEQAEVEARKQADEVLNQTLAGLHTSLQGTFSVMDQIRLMLAEQLIQLASEGKLAQDKLKEALEGLGFTEDQITYATETKTVKVAKMADNGNDVLTVIDPQTKKPKLREKDEQGNYKVPIYFPGADGKPDLAHPYEGKYEIETRDAEITISHAKINGVTLPSDTYDENGRVAEILKSHTKYWQLILKYSKQEGVDPLVMAAMMKQESGFNTRAVNKTTKVNGQVDPAAGLLQFISGTARQYGISGARRLNPNAIDYSDPRFDPEQSIQAGAKFMAAIKKKWGGDVANTAWAWYAGLGHGKTMKSDTAKHVRAVTAIYNSMAGGSLGGVHVPESAPYVEVPKDAEKTITALEHEVEEAEKKLKDSKDEKERKALQRELEGKRKEIERLKKGIRREEERDAKEAERAQKEKERDLLQTLQQEHQARLQEIAETYKVMKDSEGKIIGYMNRTGGKENQEAVIAEQKKYIAGLYDVLNQTTSSELARAKIRRQIQTEITKLREAEFKLWDYQNKLQQNERQYALEDLDRPHKFAIEMSDLTKLNSLLKEEYDLQLQLMQAEWIRTQKDEVSVQVARRKFSTTMLKNYESALKDVLTVVRQLDKAMELRQQWAGGNAITDFLHEMHIKHPNLYRAYSHEQVNWQTTQAIELRDIKIQRINDRYEAASETWQDELNKLQQLMYDKMNAASGNLKFNPAQAKEIEDMWTTRVDSLLKAGLINQEEYDAFVADLSKGGLFAISTKALDPKVIEDNISSITGRMQEILAVSEATSDAQNQIQTKWQEIVQLIHDQLAGPTQLTPEYLSPALDSYKQKIQGMLDSGEVTKEEFTAIMQEFQKRLSLPSKMVSSADLSGVLTTYKATIDSQVKAGSMPKEVSEKLQSEAERLLSSLAKGSETVDPVALKTALEQYMAVLESQRQTDGFAQEAYTKCRTELQSSIEALIKHTGDKLSLSSLQLGMEQYRQFIQARKESGKLSVESFNKLVSFVDGELTGLLQKTVPVSNQDVKTKVESFKAYLSQQAKDNIISPEELNSIISLFGDQLEGLLLTPEVTSVDAAQLTQSYANDMRKRLDAGKMSKEVFDYLVSMYREGITNLLQRGTVDMDALQASKVRATEDIQRRLAGGEITQEQADLQLAELESNFNTLLADSPLSLPDLEKQLTLLKQILQVYSVQRVESSLKEYFAEQGKAVSEMLRSVDYSKLSRDDRFVNPLNPDQILRFNETALQALFSQVTMAYAEYGKSFKEGNWKGMLAALSQLGIRVKAQVIADIEALDITDSEKAQKVLELSSESAKQVAESLASNQIEGLAKLRTEFEQAISQALDQGWETGWDIGLEYGYTAEGWDALVTSWKKMAVNTLKTAIWSQLKPQFEGWFRSIFGTFHKELQEQAIQQAQQAMQEASTEAAKRAAQTQMQTALNPQNFMSMGFFGSMFSGLFAGIFSSLLGFAISALFTDFTESIREQAEEQLKAQKDQIRAEGFGWNYKSSDSNVATPAYQFEAPTTTESIKIVRIATTINLTTDAAMAMASHRRELERVVSELVQAYERQVAKTIGTSLN